MADLRLTEPISDRCMTPEQHTTITGAATTTAATTTTTATATKGLVGAYLVTWCRPGFLGRRCAQEWKRLAGTRALGSSDPVPRVR